MKKQYKILPCPLCGSKAEVGNKIGRDPEGEYFWSVACTRTNKLTMCARIYHYGTIEAAIEIWNQRLELDKALYGD